MLAQLEQIEAWVIASRMIKADKLQETAVLERVTEHSTGGVSASWAAACQVSPETLCKVAMWSSIHTFVSHYCVELGVLTTVEFTRRVIASASS